MRLSILKFLCLVSIISAIAAPAWSQPPPPQPRPGITIPIFIPGPPPRIIYIVIPLPGQPPIVPFPPETIEPPLADPPKDEGEPEGIPQARALGDKEINEDVAVGSCVAASIDKVFGEKEIDALIGSCLEAAN